MSSAFTIAAPLPAISLPTPRPEAPAERVKKIIVRREIRARHEAIDDENPDHWKYATSTSPNETTSADRGKLRNKFRHERDNSGCLDAILQQYSGEFIGSGPRLQFNEDTEGIESWAPQVERSFASWADAVDMPGKLTMLVEAEPGDGESYLQFVYNPAVDHPVKMDLRNREAEEVATPELKLWLDPTKLDGIVQDEYGNVAGYHLLKVHPGGWLSWNAEYDTVPATSMCHWYRPIRANQGRGTSKFASTLEDMAMVRRFEKATLSKQEAQACTVAIMEVDATAADIAAAAEDSDDEVSYRPGDQFGLPRQGTLTVPKNSKFTQVQPSATTTNYEEYVDKLKTDGGRPLLAPRNRMTGDSSPMNFASGKLDILPWQDSLLRKRERLRRLVLVKIVKAWYAFALAAGEIPAQAPPFAEWSYDFAYDGFSSIDEVKDLTAAESRIRLGLSNVANECAREGRDWRQVARQRAKERKLFISLGLDPDLGMNKPAAAPPAKPTIDDEEVDPALEDTKLEKPPVKARVYV